jgi:hypothetical protein
MTSKADYFVSSVVDFFGYELVRNLSLFFFCVCVCIFNFPPADASVKKPDTAAKAAAIKPVEGFEWREQLKHVEPTHDASAPALPSKLFTVSFVVPPLLFLCPQRLYFQSLPRRSIPTRSSRPSPRPTGART